MKKQHSRMSLLLIVTFICATVTPASAVSFPDVSSNASYADAVDYVSEAGIMIGDNYGNFNPDQIVTRAEMAAIVCRMMGETSNLPTRSGFSDVADSHWACGYIAKAANLGVVNGYGHGKLGPNDTLTYEQAITMIVRALGYKSEAETQGGWPDGYLTVARDNGLLSGISSAKGQQFPRSQVAQVVYNAQPDGDSGIFAELTGKTFTFTSGAEAWATELTFGTNGMFTGTYHDSDMGDAEEEYPNGTVYFCNFSGQLYNVEKIDDLTYKVQLKTIEYENEPDEGWIDGGIRYICTYPYGLEVADTFYVYLPGHSTDDLPGGFLEWVSRPNGWRTIPAELPFWGLYNVYGDYGFYAES